MQPFDCRDITANEWYTLWRLFSCRGKIAAFVFAFLLQLKNGFNLFVVPRQKYHAILKSKTFFAAWKWASCSHTWMISILQGRWDVVPVTNNVTPHCAVSVFVDVAFSKKTVWKGSCTSVSLYTIVTYYYLRNYTSWLRWCISISICLIESQ